LTFGGNNFNDFPENQLNKVRAVLTSQTFENFLKLTILILHLTFK